MANPSRYDLKSVRLPRLAGWKLKAFVELVENPATSGLLVRQMLETGGISTLRRMVVDEPPTYRPHAPCDGPLAPAGPFDPRRPSWRPRRAGPTGSGLPTIRDYASAYLSGSVDAGPGGREGDRGDRRRATPGPQPLRAIVACLEEDVMAQARASAQRFRDGRPLGVLDGVPVAVKEEFDMVPYPTTVGTRFLGPVAGAGRTPPSSRGCVPPERCSWARRTCTRSGSA